jgi:predicted Zn-dependent protease/CheY-like chemotaxis protein
MNELAGLSALIIEPHAGMRASIHNMLNQCGVTRIDHAGSANNAVKHLGLKSFDMVLCEYDLEGGQDGQQLLEDLRHHKLISLSTMFFMVTAEGNHGKVVSAAELAPTDYILKPFTADRLLDRILRALAKRNVFMPVYLLMEEGAQREAIAACIDGENAHPRYAIDFLRLRAELHMFLGEPNEAAPIYQQLIDAKAIAWARLGLAKTLFMRERLGEAREILENLVDANKSFVDAYDWLAKTHAAAGALAQSQAVLAEAVAVSPHAVRRLRTLGEVAMETGDTDTAEKTFRQVVAKAKYSEFRDPEDHVKLVQVLVTRGEADQASAVIRDLDRSMGGRKTTTLCSAVASSLLHELTGDSKRLDESLEAALAAAKDAPGASAHVKTALARNCLAHDKVDGAAALMRDVMRESPDGAAMARAMAVFEQAGCSELAATLAQETHQEVVDLVAQGALRAQQRDFRGAVDLMTAAVEKLPNNPQVVFNAAVAVLKCLDNEGWDERLGKTAQHLIGSMRRLDPVNPKLPALAGLHQQILKKYDKGARLKA